MGKNKKLLIAAGGSGGHLFPAEALFSEIAKETECLFAGAKLSENRFLNKSYPYENISSTPHLYDLFTIGQGVIQSIQLIRKFQPSLIAGFGSYHTLPIMMAAVFTKTPYVLFCADAKPGRVIRLFAPFAQSIASVFPDTFDKAVKVDMPLRPHLSTPMSQSEARAFFGLNEKEAVILVVGGSQGSSFINEQVGALYGKKLSFTPQWIHITGSVTETEKALAMRSKLSESIQKRIVIRSFEEKMLIAWRASDIALTRAGSVSLAEQYFFQVPGIAIPFPEAKDNHQEFNGRYYEKLGLVKVLQQKEITNVRLQESLEKIYLDRKAHIVEMKRASSRNQTTLAEVIRKYL